MAIIDKPSDYFNTKLYTGDGTNPRAITGVGFQPDWVWNKPRSAANSHALLDSVRGATKFLSSDVTDAEYTYGHSIQSFDSDGFTCGDNASFNQNGTTYASWNWKAGGTAVSNTNGSITSSVSANQDAGFSIVSFTTTSGGNATIGHGLGSVPKMIIMKSRTNTYNWDIYHVGIGNAKRLVFTTAASETSPVWGSTTPTSSVFTMDQSFYGSGYPVIAYCFAEKQGYSKFGSYVAGSDTTAKPNNDGTFIYTGFKPRFIMTKRTDGTSNWCIFDTVRSTLNPMYNILFPNISDAENTSEPIDVYSNGWKPRADSGYFNYPAGSNWIYYAIAENPFVTSTGVPTTAR